MEAKRRGRKIGIFFLDEEVVYQSTIDQVEYIIEQIAPENVTPLWLQIEFHLTNATSLTETQFIPWEAGKHKIWMRPKKSYAIKFPPWDRATQYVADKNKGFGFYDVFYNFERCYHNAAFLVGRAETESPNRGCLSKNGNHRRLRFIGTQKGVFSVSSRWWKYCGTACDTQNLHYIKTGPINESIRR